MLKKFFKLLCIFVSIVMLSGLLAGCGSSQKSSDNSTKTKQTKEEQLTSEKTSEKKEETNNTDNTPVTLTCFRNSPMSPTNWKWGDDSVSKKITELTGITVDIKCATTSDSTELNTMLASGTKLPDFIITNTREASGRMLIEQGFAQPLNVLADKYSPEFWNNLPKDMDKIYSEPDGNFYSVVSWYGDPQKLSKLEVKHATLGAFMLNKSMHKAIGEPDIKTLDDYKKALLEIKAKYPDLPFYFFDRDINAVDSPRNAVQLINRIYGGNQVISVQSNSKVNMNFRDESYIKALKYLNDFYREGLFNPELFTMQRDQYNAAAIEEKFYTAVGQAWTTLSMVPNGMAKDGPYTVIDFPVSTGLSKSDIRITDYALDVGKTGTYISKDSKNPDRAIGYLAFLYSDQGQMLLRYGVENDGWVRAEDGTPVWSDKQKEAQAKGFDVWQRTLGANNWNIAWTITRWAELLGKHNEYATDELYVNGLDYKFGSQYASDERLESLASIINDEDMRIIHTQVMELWKKTLPEIILAKSEEDCMDAYGKFIKSAEKEGLLELEEYYTNNYKKWKDKLGM